MLGAHPQPHPYQSLGRLIIMLDNVGRKNPMGESEKLPYADDIIIRASSKENLEEIVTQWYGQLR